MSRCAIYARVSTTDQTCENQLRDLRAHAQQRGWEIAEEYVDAGWSGAKESRPALDRLMKDAWAGKFQVVLVWRFDRFARSTKYLVTALETFRSLKVGFISLTEQIDTSSPWGEAIFTIIAALAQLERSGIIERIHAGLRRARAQGKVLGPKRKEVDLVRARALLSEGMSMRKAAKVMGLKAETLRRRVAQASAGRVQGVAS